MKTRILAVIAVVFGGTLVNVGCGGGGGAAGQRVLDSVSRSVGSEGGTLTLKQDVGGTLNVPANTLSRSTNVVFEGLTPTALSPPLSSTGNSLRISVDSTSFSSATAAVRLQGVSIQSPDGPRPTFIAEINGVPVGVREVPGSNNATYTISLSQALINNVNQLAGGRSVTSASSQSRSRSSGDVVQVTPAKPEHDPSPAVTLLRYARGSGFVSDPSDWKHGRICLVIHGIQPKAQPQEYLNGLAQLADRILSMTKADGVTPIYDQVWGAQYEWCAGVRPNALLLSQRLIERGIASNPKHFDIVAHSMGGLVARWCIEKQGISPYVARLFTLGTPHFGVPIPNDTSTVLGFDADTTVRNEMDCFGQGLSDLLRDTPGSSIPNFQRALNDGPSQDRARIIYFTVAGNRYDNYKVGKVPIGRLMSLVYTGDDDDQDGIVPVRSAQYSLLADKSEQWLSKGYKITVQFNHSELPNAQPVIDQIQRWLSDTQVAVEATEPGVGPSLPAFGVPAIARNPDARLEAFAIGTDGKAYHAWQRTSDFAWGQWEQLSSGAALTGRPAIGTNPGGGLEVFARGQDGHIYHTWQTGGWPRWQSLNDGRCVGDPAVSSNASGSLEVFAHGTNGAMYHTWQSNNWQNWEPVNGTSFPGNPAVGRNSDGGLELFARGNDNRVYHTWQSGGWPSWEPLNNDTFAGDPDVATNKDGSLEVFARSTGGNIYHIWQKNGWDHWEKLGDDVFHDDPHIGVNSDGGLEVFIRNSVGQIFHNWQSTGWPGWQNIGGNIDGNVAVALDSGGHLLIAGRGGPNGKVSYNSQAGNWSRWIQIGQ